METLKVVLYTREDCSLCDKAKVDLSSLQDEIPHRLVEVDIEIDQALRRKYAEAIPVVEVGPYKLVAPFNVTDLRVTLSAAKRGDHQSAPVVARERRITLGLNKIAYSFSRHWLAVFNILVFLYVSLPFLAPTLMKVGATRPASWIYTIYSPLCHQLAYRSWFLFGDQPAYPKEMAGTSLTSFEEATGIDDEDIWAAKEYVGNEKVGYKVALCERDVAIYGGILIAGLIFGLVRNRVKPLPIWIWFVVGVLPMAIDGGSQLLASIPFLPIPARESTPLLRTITGALFGIMCVWMAYPYVEGSMVDTQAQIATNLASAADKEAATSSKS
ncbi:MAG: DUF2085 domain-containing protein [Anaerolineales bacterium]|nr:DUF2085 domain-containing protein [Anaerolineales bacterium]